VSTAASPPAAASGPVLTSDRNLHMLRRLTFGPSPASVAEINSLGSLRWLEDQLNPAVIDDHVCAGYLARYPRLAWTIQSTRAHLSNGAWDLMEDLGEATLLRATWSRRQLFEVMVEFWSNHLNVTNPSSDVWDNRHDYDANVIRKYTFGKFSDMLWASANHPAMMRYLNNADSTPPDFNENYGRELLELHTVGVDGGYTEVDMRNSALIMSGYGVHDPWPSDANTGIFEYIPDNHYVGPVTVMGFSSPNATAAGGYAVGKAYLSYLATHPSTAKRIADKLITRFISDDPRPALSARLAATYLAHGTAIVPVLRQLFTSREFQYAVGHKVRRPLEDLIASLRTLGITPDPGTGTDGIQALWWESDNLGQQPMAWALPNGYPDTAPDWQSTNGTLERWNIHMALAGQWWPVQASPPMLQAPPLASFLPSPLPANYGTFVDLMAERLVYQKLGPDARAAVLAFMGQAATDPVASNDAYVSWRFPYLIALILDSVYHTMR
ncbi:MAG TPA: DUF1800 domain-containing protein, partial [Actinomycetes bacterium]